MLSTSDLHHARPNRPVALSASPGALDLLRALRRRWLLGLMLALLVVPAIVALTWSGLPSVLPAKSVVRTTLHVSAKHPTILSGVAAENRLDFATYQRTQTALVKSRLVLNAAFRNPKVATLAILNDKADPIQWVEKEIKADYTIAPEILSISMTGDHPDELSILVEAIRDAYLQEIVNREQTELNTRLERLNEYYTARANRVDTKRKAVRGLAEGLGSRDPVTLARLQQYLLDRLGTAQKELAQFRSELRRLQAEVLVEETRAKAIQDAPIPEKAVEEEILKDPAVGKHRQEVARRDEEVEKCKRLAARGDDDPTLQQAVAALAVAQKALAERREKLRPLILEHLREKTRNELQANAAARRGRIDVYKQLEQEADKEVKGLEKETDKLKTGAVVLDAQREELAEEEEALKRIRAQIQALTIELQAPARVTLLEKITVAQKEGRRAILTGLAGLGALMLVLLGVAWREFSTRRVNGVQQVVDGLGIRLFGAIPALPGRARRVEQKASKSRDSYWRTRLTESIDMTRAMLVRTAQKEGLRVVMVTSALPGEGKTSLASHLAISLAHAGFRTLLIDGDLRRPTVHRVFKLEESAGFNELLRDEASLEEVIQATQVPGLSIVVGGGWNSQTTRALARQKIQTVLAELRPSYDFILIDSSPVLPVADPLLIGQHADAVLFSILRDVSRLPSIYAAYERVSALGIRILGAVVNGACEDGYEARYQSILPVESKSTTEEAVAS
jgi:capsular exopolysaccharide synthesis family protein